MRLWQKIYVKCPVVLFDVLCIPFAWYAAFCLRFNLDPLPPPLIAQHAVFAFGLLLVVQVISYAYFKIDRGLWRFASISDVKRIIQAIVCTNMVVIPFFYAFSWLRELPRSVMLLYSVLLLLSLCSGRLLSRDIFDRKKISDQRALKQRVLIVGAGHAGASLVRELLRTSSYLPMGFVDDSISHRGYDVHGVRVLGTIPDLQALSKQLAIDLIFIAIPSANAVQMRRILSYCDACNLPTRTLPGLSDIVAGRVSVDVLRHVNLDDLLGREQVTIESDKVAHALAGCCVLITGAGGSIGSELCRQVSAFSPQRLVLVDHHEFNLYQIERDLAQFCPLVPIELVLASVTDEPFMQGLLTRVKPDVVLHAAAYKQVPLLESQIRMAVHNNVWGTQVMALASVQAGVKKFILISTDKAVNPTNVMGASKRVAEIFCQNLNERTQTQFITVRFGNVLGSVGSVVPLFQEQLQKGGPLTVTHPDMERYFMTIPEASLLILQAMVNGVGGEIFVLDMGEPVKISYLAEQMIRLSGKQVGKDIAIEYTGLRPGEKLYEELFHASESLIKTAHSKLFKAKVRMMPWHELTQSLRMLHEACTLRDDNEVLILLQSLVPEFQYTGQTVDCTVD